MKTAVIIGFSTANQLARRRHRHNLVGLIRRLSARGVAFKFTPNQVTWGIDQGAWTACANGPDVIALELLQPAQPANP